MNKDLYRSFNLVIGISFTLVVLTSLVFSTGIVDTGDGIAHFNISRYSWKYPNLLLDHWGKPLFTLLSSPFAQLGIKGMILFNLVCALLTGHFLIKAAKPLGIEQRWLVLLCLFAAPVYFNMVIAGLTEVLFALLCAWAISLLLQAKHINAAIILSFLPFARPEAYIILPFFILYLMWKDWRSLPYLLLGTVAYAVVGAIVLDDFLWLINKDPYANAEVGVYGFGNPLDFVKSTKDILGIPITIIFLLGMILVSVLKRTEETTSSDKRIQYWLLLILPAIAILAVHSYLWWKGLHGSAGLKRVIATSAPMVALVAGAGLDRLASFLPMGAWRKGFLGIIAFVLCFTLYDRVDIIVEYNRKHLTAQKASQWLAEELEEDQRLFYLDPLVGFELKIDPYDQEKSVRIWSMEREGPNAMQSGDIIFWETHFAPQEGGLPKAELLEDMELDLIYEDAPLEPYPMRDTTYEVLIFRKK